MNRLERALERTLWELQELAVPAALVGGLAVSIRSEPRFTRDIDLAVDVADDAAAERLIHDLAQRSYLIGTVLEQSRTGRMATVRMTLPGEGDGGVVVDMLLASSGIEHEVVLCAEQLEAFPNLHLPVASTGHLIALKLLAQDEKQRPQDSIDLSRLLVVADEQQLALAHQAVSMIVERGYHRGRDLIRRLNVAIANHQQR